MCPMWMDTRYWNISDFVINNVSWSKQITVYDIVHTLVIKLVIIPAMIIRLGKIVACAIFRPKKCRINFCHLVITEVSVVFCLCATYYSHYQAYMWAHNIRTTAGVGAATATHPFNHLKHCHKLEHEESKKKKKKENNVGRVQKTRTTTTTNSFPTNAGRRKIRITQAWLWSFALLKV